MTTRLTVNKLQREDKYRELVEKAQELGIDLRPYLRFIYIHHGGKQPSELKYDTYSNPVLFSENQGYIAWQCLVGSMTCYDSKSWDVTREQVTCFCNNDTLFITRYSPKTETLKDSLKFWESIFEHPQQLEPNYEYYQDELFDSIEE